MINGALTARVCRRYPDNMTPDTTPAPATPMRTLEIPLSEVTEQHLRRRAAERGVPVEELAQAILEREAAAPVRELTAEEWIADLRAWAASHPARDITVDDSRDSIYEGCGE